MGIQKAECLPFSETPTFVSFSCENWQVPTGYYGNFIIKRRRLFLHYAKSWELEEGFIGFKPALSPSPWGGFSFDPGPRKGKKVDDMLWGPCDADFSRHPPVSFRVYWTLDYRLQHGCGKSNRLKKVFREFPSL